MITYRCTARHVNDPRPCSENPTVEIRDHRGGVATGCYRHAVTLVASMSTAIVDRLPHADESAVAEVLLGAVGRRPFDFRDRTSRG